MSSRVLKKLHGTNDLGLAEHDDHSEPENQIISGGARKVNVNPYDLFNDESMSESEVKEDDNETEHASASAATSNRTEQTKKKKKKRKKKGKQQTSAGQRRSSEDKSDMDEIIRSLKEVEKLTSECGARSKNTQPRESGVIKELLSVQHKNLNPSYEMKRMFGSKVIQAEQNKRRNARGMRAFKSTWLVTAKDNWPVVTKTGIYMSVEQTPTDSEPSTSRQRDSRGLIWFRFEHNASYRALQEKFLTAVESLDSDNIIQVINQQPYHVDSLIQLSELCKMSEDHAMASELIEHAILSLETSFHSMFSLTAGNCRLDYRRQENRAIFVTLFKHAQYLEGRACPRTALEVAKLILSFDPDTDPLAMILVIDYFALRAQQYEWLIQLYDEWESTNNLAQLPNMAYSYAMALFYHHGEDDTTLADAALQYALLMFPGVLKPLLHELSVQTDSRANTHAYFGPASVSGQRPALLQLTALYTVRTKIVWQDPRLLGWMERNVNAVLDKVDARDPLVADFSAKRNQRYNTTPPKAILRHIILADFKEKVPLEPFINKDTEPILMYDPLPPNDSINIYHRPNMTRPTRTLNADASPLSMFFQSLLPTFNAQDLGPVVDPVPAIAAPNANPVAAERFAIDPEANDVAGAIGEVAAGIADELDANRQSFTELRTSLNSIVDAMRDFLTNIRVPERPNDADVDENESSDDEPNDYLT